MKKVVFLLLLGVYASSLVAYSDSDMDGVEDSRDKCPNTPFTDLVDFDGCTKKKLQVKVDNHHYDVIIGAGYSGSNFASLNRSDTAIATLQADYYYKDFSLQAYTSYYSTKSDSYSDNGLNDSFVGGAYTLHPTASLSVRLGAGALLPTYDTVLNNNNTDYTASINVSYNVKKWNLFGGYIYTQVNDDTVVDNNVTYSYEDTNGYTLGAGYYVTSSLYLSTSYNLSNSIYTGVEDIESVSAYGYKSLSKHTFMTFSYTYGLSESASDHAASVRLGWYY